MFAMYHVYSWRRAPNTRLAYRPRLVGDVLQLVLITACRVLRSRIGSSEIAKTPSVNTSVAERKAKNVLLVDQNLVLVLAIGLNLYRTDVTLSKIRYIWI
jgi:hypothetical protein